MKLTVLQRIVLRRQLRGWSSADLARALGMTPKAWWKIETGEVRLRAEHVPGIAAALETTIADLYGEQPARGARRPPGSRRKRPEPAGGALAR